MMIGRSSHAYNLMYIHLLNMTEHTIIIRITILTLAKYFGGYMLYTLNEVPIFNIFELLEELLIYALNI